MTTTHDGNQTWSWLTNAEPQGSPSSPGTTGMPGTTGTTVKQASALVAHTASHAWGDAPSFNVLLPVKAWWAANDWKRGAPLLFLVFGLGPWAIMHAMTVNDSITKAAWGFSVYFAVLWALVMWALIRPGKLDWALVAKVAAASAVFGIPLAIWLEKRLGNGTSLLTYTFGVGLPEELAKALPVFVLMVVLANGKQYSTRMFMYLGAVSGLAFGAVEAVKYSPSYAQGLAQGQATGLLAAEVFWRLLTDGLFHAATAAITCYFIGLAARNVRWRNQLIGFGLAVTTVLHGVNDRYSEGWLQVAIAAAILFIFIGYVLSGDQIESQVQQVNQSLGVPHV